MPKVLIVDDNEADRDLIGRRLERSGFSPCLATDAPSGISLAGSERPDVILMDISLGELDGWEAIRRLKADRATASIPIIVLTSYPMESDPQRSAKAGCADFETKPVHLPRLLDKINACLAKGHRATN